jgi:D-amino-acid oxidase
MKVAVVGGGAQGLSVAYFLFKANISVDVIWDRPGTMPPNALWGLPVYKVEPADLCSRWAFMTFEEYLKMKDKEECGVYFPAPFYSVSRKPRPKNPDAHLLSGFRDGPQVLQDATLLAVCGSAIHQFVNAQVYDAVLVDTQKHFEWLRREISSMGGTHIRRSLQSLFELKGYDWIINCSGIGAHSLVNDKAVFPIKGILLIYGYLKKLKMMSK